jgi:hypothetical protein
MRLINSKLYLYTFDTTMLLIYVKLSMSHPIFLICIQLVHSLSFSCSMQEEIFPLRQINMARVSVVLTGVARENAGSVCLESFVLMYKCS